MVFALSQ